MSKGSAEDAFKTELEGLLRKSRDLDRQAQERWPKSHSPSADVYQGPMRYTAPGTISVVLTHGEAANAAAACSASSQNWYSRGNYDLAGLEEALAKKFQAAADMTKPAPRYGDADQGGE